MNDTLFIGFAAATIRISTLFILAGIGELIIEKAGVLNLGIEGMLLFSACMGFIAAYFLQNPWLGFILGTMSAIPFGLLIGLLEVSWGRVQHISGLAVTWAAGAFSVFFFDGIFGIVPVPPMIKTIGMPGVSGLLHQSWITYLAFLFIPVMFYITRTKWWQHIKAVGENPKAVENAGLGVHKLRYQAILFGSLLIGAGGAFLTVGELGFFTKEVVGGRGWVILALVVLGKWNTKLVFAAALLFGFLDAGQVRFQTFADLPSQLYHVIPYVLTLIAMALARGESGAPEALLKPYPEEVE